MDLIEVAQNKNRWDERLWNGSSWLRRTTGGMCGYGMDRVGSEYGQVRCMVMEWIELAEVTDRWDVRLWTGSSWLSVWTGGMCGYGLDRAG